MNKNIWIAIGLFILFVIVLSVMNWFGKVTDVISEEIDPRNVQVKYEEFKIMHATLESKLANIDVQAGKIDNMEESYEGILRNEWNRADINSYNLWQSELDGTIMSFNNLADDYNAAMAMWNYRFCNIGTLPEGATEPLPREFAQYIYE